MTAVIERKEKSVIVVVAKAVSRGFSEIRSLRVGRFGRWAVTQEEGNFDSISIASAVPSVQLHVSRRECCASRCRFDVAANDDRRSNDIAAAVVVVVIADAVAATDDGVLMESLERWMRVGGSRTPSNVVGEVVAGVGGAAAAAVSQAPTLVSAAGAAAAQPTPGVAALVRKGRRHLSATFCLAGDTMEGIIQCLVFLKAFSVRFFFSKSLLTCIAEG
ncbi:neurobeachin isoform X1 [Aphis craccivora]|uniref:Neurobeachin isoform X1 n=1 Tax=Aphis craccivora TaxID=307492 RepID=A0A6G0ZN87_APHCR|nr:neurobeachin isoform X1 [Aphis craccivora]